MLLGYLAIVLFLLFSTGVVGDTIVVDSDGEGDTTNILYAVERSNPGDMIFISDGVYEEQVITIETPNLSIIGESMDGVVIKPIRSFGFSVKADYVRISNIAFILRDGVTGITLHGSSHIVVENNTFINGGTGIRMKTSYGSDSNNITVRNCLFHKQLYGMQIQSENVLIEGNIIEHNSVGIYLEDTRGALDGFIVVTDNNIMFNSVGIRFKNAVNADFYHNNIMNNTIALSHSSDAISEMSDNSIQWNNICHNIDHIIIPEEFYGDNSFSNNWWCDSNGPSGSPTFTYLPYSTGIHVVDYLPRGPIDIDELLTKRILDDVNRTYHSIIATIIEENRTCSDCADMDLPGLYQYINNTITNLSSNLSLETYYVNETYMTDAYLNETYVNETIIYETYECNITDEEVLQLQIRIRELEEEVSIIDSLNDRIDVLENQEDGNGLSDNNEVVQSQLPGFEIVIISTSLVLSLSIRRKVHVASSGRGD